MTELVGPGAGSIREVKLLLPEVFSDARGSFRETYREDRFREDVGHVGGFAQDSHGWSHKGVVRGIHYQIEPMQGKLVWPITGEIFDIAVDLRRSSPTFGQWVGAVLSRENGYQMWVPGGFGHGYAVRSDGADVLYKSTSAHNPASYQAIRWNDADLGIDWGLPSPPTVSARDAAAPLFGDAIVFD